MMRNARWLLPLLLAGAAFAQTRPQFEVAEVRVNKSGERGDSKGLLPSGQIALRNVPLQDLVQFAYDVRDGYLVGAPGWMASDRFDIVAKAPAGSPDATVKLMLQSLLEREFKLSLHTEQRPRDVYVLSVGKGGAKLQSAAGSGRSDCQPSVTPQGETQASCTGITMAELAARLPRWAPSYVDKEVIDMTGLTGGYDFKLAWTQLAAIDQGGLTVFDAIDKTLGLKLEAAKRPVSVTVIDQVEKLRGE
jgi:uncharacterized protein (TIGR03435 family)